MVTTTEKIFVINRFQGKSAEGRQSRKWLRSHRNQESIGHPQMETRFSLRKALLIRFLFHHKISATQPTEIQKSDCRKLFGL